MQNTGNSAHQAKKQVGKREEDLSGLPIETIEYTLPESEQICPECGNALHEMTKEIRRALTIILAQVKVTEHVSHVYSCRNCEKAGTSTPIMKAPSPEAIINGSLAHNGAEICKCCTTLSTRARFPMQWYYSKPPDYGELDDSLL